MSAPRLPTQDDFPSSVVLSITPPPASLASANVLILLHGLGDTHVSFTRLAQQLQLPYTVIISLRGPTPVPAMFTGSEAPSFTWGDDVLFDQNTGGLDMDAGFKATKTMVLDTVIKDVLISKCNYKHKEIHLMGFGQGAMAALYIATLLSSDEEFGGIIAIGGSLPESSAAVQRKSKSPVLLLGGSRSSVVTQRAVSAIKANFEVVEYVKWAKANDSMPGSRDEMLPLMKFWARRLGSRAGVPAGSVELGR